VNSLINYQTQWLDMLMPELIVVITALVVLLTDVTLIRGKSLCLRGIVGGVLSVLGCVLAAARAQLPSAFPFEILSITPMVVAAKTAILVLACFTALIRPRFTQHIGEYFALLLLAVVGLMLLVSTTNLLLIFIALELLSISLYALVAFEKFSLAASEAALKYFLFGGMAAAFTLFGISLLYGMTGSIDLREIATHLKDKTPEPVFYLALVMTLIGFAYKLAAAPFHLWAPDAYQGAPTPVAAFIASGSKIGSFMVLARILFEGFGNSHGSAGWGHFQAGWMPMIAVIAVTSMIVGNVAAIAQTNVKRLLAYSAIAHGGYALLALFAKGPQSIMPALMFYVITYAVTVLGAFAVVSVVESDKRRGDFSDFAGLSRRAPVLSACLAIFMLSLAGIPPLVGFVGKFFVFVATTGGEENLRLLWLVIVAISASAVSLYYYLQVLKRVYVMDVPAQPAPLATSKMTLAVILVLAVIVLALGCMPDLLLGQLQSLASPSFGPEF
jgi:NADH-quinone oxidoreductase subunit N